MRFSQQPTHRFKAKKRKERHKLRIKRGIYLEGRE